MTERIGWNHSLTCDHCKGKEKGGRVEGFDEFEQLVKYKKENGWKSLKSERGKWFEFCPVCAVPEIMNEYRSK